jgi:hypothetical protein
MVDDQNVVAAEQDEQIEQTSDAVAPETDGEAAVVEATPEAEAGAASPRLIVKRGGVETDDVFPLTASAIIGRFDPSVGPIDVDLGALPEGVYVSRKHAKITEEDGVWKLTDLGSSNGTFVLRGDFERVEETELSDGDEIALGNARFVFRLQ